MRSLNIDRRRGVLAMIALGAAALLLVTLSLLAPPAAPQDPTVATGGGLPTVCDGVPGETPTYFADQAPPGSNYFGPAAPNESVVTAQADNHNRICLDSALTVALGEYFSGNTVDEATRQQRIADANANRGQWLLGVAGLESKMAEAESVEIETVTATYWTMYMVPQPGGIPLIQQSQESMVNQPVLRFTYADGTVKRLKLVCGFQPVEPEPFPGVPPLGSPPPAPPVTSPPSVPPTVPPVTTPPSTPPTTRPNGKHESECNQQQVCRDHTTTTRVPTTTVPTTTRPTTPATTLVPEIPDNPTCPGGYCPDHPSPTTVAPPAPQPTTTVPRTTPPTTPPSSG